VADLESQLRPFTAEEWPQVADIFRDVFAEELTGPLRDRPSPVAELDRSLALWDGDRLVATAGIYSLEMTVPGAVVPCAGVTWVTVSPTHRRQGVLSAIMRRQLTELHERSGEPVAALWAAESAIYGRFGYAPATWRGGWTGQTERLRLRPDVDTGQGRVKLLSMERFRSEVTGTHDRMRRLVPGDLARDERWWERTLRGDEDGEHKDQGIRQYAVHREPDGEVTGYAIYRAKGDWSDTGEPQGTVRVEELRAETPTAYASLWRFVLSLDLMRTVRYQMGPSDDPLRHLLHDPRALHSQPVDALWVRLVDVDRALAARRYPAPIDLVLEVGDRFCPWNAGRWRLTGHPAGARCARTDRDPDLLMDVEALAAAYLGGVSLATLQGAGRVIERSPGAVTLAATAFGWPVAPWCPVEF
jgi:predicted acetyltransferase